jgi:hypothetical protein
MSELHPLLAFGIPKRDPTRRRSRTGRFELLDHVRVCFGRRFGGEVGQVDGFTPEGSCIVVFPDSIPYAGVAHPFAEGELSSA